MAEEVIDQIWYTWSSVGLDDMRAGYRVRAASPGLSDLQGIHYRTIAHYLHYRLPEGVDPNTILPEKAPISLALVSTQYGRILVQRLYTGEDGVGRPGNYFSHLLTNLPDTFSARDAIRLWKSPLWQDHDVSPEEQSPLLNALSFDDLKNYADPNSQLARVQKFKFATVQNSLRGIIKAFLSPTRLKQHLYIIGGSERIAMLIWGLTHSIPETLLPGLTFTTYEHDPDKSNETIVGTITSDALVIPDRAKIRITITPSYSSYTNTTVDEYVSFAVDCLIQHGNGHSPQLNALVKQAEEKNITTVEEFMELFQQFTAKKDPSQLIRDLINALLRSDWSQVARICNEFTALFPPEDSEAVWSSLFQSLSEEPLICEHILQDWNTYTWLFSGLAATIALPNADTLDLWLSGSWDNLRMLLSLDVPENWRREAVALTLLSPKQSRSNMVEVVQEHKQLVTDVLQQFVIEPEEEYAEAVLDFLHAWKPDKDREKKHLCTVLINTSGIYPETQRRLIESDVEPGNQVPPSSTMGSLASPTAVAPTKPQIGPILADLNRLAVGSLFGAIRRSMQHGSKLLLGLSIFLIIDILLLLISVGMFSSATNRLNQATIRATVVAQITATAQADKQATATASRGTDNYTSIGKSGGPKVKSGEKFAIFLALHNSGTSTWSDAGGYQLVCVSSDTDPAPDPDCTGGTPQGFMGTIVPPDHNYVFYITLTAPSTPTGKHMTIWRLEHNGTPFGQDQVLTFSVE